MTKLFYSLIHEIEPLPPYNFDFTMKKPAGWPLFTPFEVYEDGIMWTATHLHDHLVGLQLISQGTTSRSRIVAKLFLDKRLQASQLKKIKKSLARNIGAEEDLTAFYDLAKRDEILKYVMDDLYGMHNTSSSTIFPDASLAILLQMTNIKRSNDMMNCFISRYGETAEFEGMSIQVWPLPKIIAELDVTKLARACNMGFRAKYLVQLAKKIETEKFPTVEELTKLKPEEAKKLLLDLPGIGDYSADIINPHGGFPIDVWSVDVFGKLFFGQEPKDKRGAISRIKNEGLRRWDRWSWMAFFYIVQDLENLSRKLGLQLRRS
jgi:3-methyladenine DNA glycosylase/8-oxoguanine DNA glycosylase